ncbi:MAG: leucine-rich repeat domain-containing protein [Chitinophagales bacterium]|nr:leucine-rich repeat domain-containing protein [Chitinophagales bacterium]
MTREAKQLIARSKAENWKRLDLGRCGLTDLATQVPELFELTDLEELVLSNIWWEWSETKQRWEEKRSANQGKKNRIKQLPQALRNLKKLRVFICGGELGEHWDIRDISALSGLSALTSLNLNDNQLTNISELSGLGALTSLYLSGNQLTDISDLSGLAALASLDLSDNQLTDVSDLSGLAALTSLDLCDNQLTDISALSGLSALTSLYLRDNQLTHISDLSGLAALTSLNLSGNQLTDISPLSGLDALISLYLRSNQLTDVSGLSRLAALTTLDLHNNQLTDVSPLSGLSALTTLYLSSNQLTDVSGLSRLAALTTLDLHNNKLTNVSPLSGLSALKELVLSYNQLTDISPLSGLSALTTLYLHNNQLTDLSPLLPHYQRGIYIDITNNPISNPPEEIRKKGDRAIIEYLLAVERGKRPLNELKVLLVGEGAAGKTSLMKAICEKTFNPKESQTHGINIRKQPIKMADDKELLLHLWDFGGQEIMHATHQFFLSERSLYILVLDSRKDEKAEYWLKHIESFGGDSPVLVVLNKIDENPSFALNEAFLLKKYPNIVGFFKVSCQTQQGIVDLVNSIGNTIVDKNMCNTIFPNTWWNVKEAFENLKKDYISYQDYYGICSQNLVKSEKEQNLLLGFLNDLGIVLHYEKLNIHDTQVLNPHWLTNGVYRVINSPSIAKQNGVFYDDKMDSIMQDPRYPKNYTFPRDKYAFLLGMMKQFELCYEVRQRQGTYIIPELLDIEQKAISFKETQKQLHLVLFYPDFLPNSILPRLMVRLHDYIFSKKRWRTGMVLYEPNIFRATANIIADKEEKRIDISIVGEKRQDFLTFIRKSLQSIHQSFPKLEVEELIPLPDKNKYDKAEYVNYEELLGLSEMEQTQYFSGILRKSYSVKDLLTGVAGEQYRAKRVFISYAQEDLPHLETLKAQLSVFERNKTLQLWYDREMKAGEEWDKSIQAQLQSADVILLLISADYFKVEKNYIWNNEMPSIIRRCNEKVSLVIPIIVRDCLWQEDKWLSQLQAVTAIGEGNRRIPLLSATNKDEAFADAARQIKKTIDSFRRQGV